VILDTTVIIDVLNKHPEAIAKLQELLEKNEPIIITTPSIFELWSCVAQSKKPEEEKQKIKQVLQHQIIWDLDEPAAEKAGLIDGTLISQGKQIQPEDAMIAGIALTNKDDVLTRNVKDFAKAGVKVQTY